MVHAVYSIFKHGICPELPTLTTLPVSTKQNFWHLRAAYLEHSFEDETLKYIDITALWLAAPARKLEAFEKVIIVACKGLEAVKAHHCDRVCRKLTRIPLLRIPWWEMFLRCYLYMLFKLK